MSREDYVAIATRLVAVYLGVQLILQVPAVIEVLTQDGRTAGAWVYLLVLLPILAVCAFLWFFPLTVARKLLPVMKESRSEQAIDASVGLSLGITLIGLWLLARGVIDASYWLTMLGIAGQMDEPEKLEWTPNQIASMVSCAMQVLAGAALVLGSSGVKRLIQRYRYGDARTEAQSEA